MVHELLYGPTGTDHFRQLGHNSQMNQVSAGSNPRLTGTGVAPGLAMGRAFVYKDLLEGNPHVHQIQPEETKAEYGRFDAAIREVLADLETAVALTAHQVGPNQAMVFDSHRIILEEVLELGEIRWEIETEHVNAEGAVQRVFQRWIGKIHAEESSRFLQRTDDIADIGRRILRKLMGVSVHPLERMPEGAVLVAPRLLPSDAVFLATRGTAATVVEFGGAASHCSLITRQIGIPGVCNVMDATEAIHDGDTVLVDGFGGDIVVSPDEDTRRQFAKSRAECRVNTKKARAHCHDQAVTQDGRHVQVMANVLNAADVRVAVENGADGIGLYRLEGLFMLRNCLPTEQQLLAEMSEVTAPFADRPVIIRLLDLGADKSLPYFEFTAEPAPCLGMRGVRLLLAHPELLKVQLRALLCLSQDRHIQIMVPMVTLPDDMRAIRETVEGQAAELGITKIPPLVAMVETPAAALSVSDILQFADSISLGTNDLTQHTMAAGRQNPLVQRYYQDGHPVVFRLIRIAAAESQGTVVGVCGELAGQPTAIPSLLEAGVRVLSVSPPLVPAIKEAVRQTSVRQTGGGDDHGQSGTRTAVSTSR